MATKQNQLVRCAVMACVLLACSTPTTPPQPAPTSAKPLVVTATPALDTEEPKRVFEQFAAKQTKALWPRLSAELRRTIGTEGGFAEMATSIERDLGGEAELLSESVKSFPHHAEYHRTVRYHRAPNLFTVIVSVERDGTITKLGIAPQTQH